MSPNAEIISEEDFISSERVPIGTGAPNDNAEGTLLGPLERYRIVAPLGKGGMAEVFLAAWEVAPQVQRPVVIKRLYTHLGDDSNLVQMFIDEARLACGFEHENIVKTIEVGIIDGQCCIAMEYLAGQSLQRLLRHSWSSGGVPIDIAVHVMARALDALAYAHGFEDHRGASLGIVHRDISPHNIFVTNTGHIKLLDFGVAKANSHEARTATGYVKGKLAYIAPEQARAKPVDQRADIWSLGVVFWEMLVGTRLFRAETDAATLNATLGADIPKPSTLRAEVAPELDRIVMRALQRNVMARYQSAQAMRRDLEQYALRMGHHADTSGVARLMREHFAEEMEQQRKLVFDLREQGDTAAASTRTPTALRGTKSAAAQAALALDLTRVDGLLDQVSRSHRLIVRMLLGALMFVTALGSFVIFTLVVRQGRSYSEHAPRSTTQVVRAAARNAPSEPTQPVPSASIPSPPHPAEGSPAVETPANVQTPPTSKAGPANTKRGYWRATAAPANVAETGLLNLDSMPWSSVTMNGRPLGQTPLLGIKLPVGTHVLTLRNSDLGLETQYSVTIEAGRTVSRRVGLQ